MILFRISKKKYSNDLSGEGARLFGGRWNLKGFNLIYTSESRALASIEFLVHTPPSLLPIDLDLVSIEIEDKIKPAIITTRSLPDNWKEFPPPNQLADIGTKWIISNKSLLLKVPSALVEEEFNVLINPNHSDFKHVKINKINPYKFDKRLHR